MHYDILARENVRIISPVISGSYRNFVPSEWFNVCLFLIRTVILWIITTERAVEFFSGALFGRQVSLFISLLFKFYVFFYKSLDYNATQAYDYNSSVMCL